MRRRPVALRHHLLAGVLALVVALLVPFDVITVVALRTFQLHQTDQTLAEIVDTHRGRAADLLARADAGGDLVPHDYYLAVVTGGRAVTLVDVRVPPRLPDDLTELARSGRDRTVDGVDGTSSFRLRAVSTDAGILVAAADLGPVNTPVHHLAIILVVGTAVLIAALVAGGLVVVRRGLRPLESMAGQADRITAGDLTHRVQPQTAGTEVGRLGHALNRMLDRIETSLNDQEASKERMRRFLADASHELRTPLMSLRANADLYEQGALTDRAQVAEAMRRIRISAQRMGVLVDDMLQLARLDQRPGLELSDVDVAELLARSVADARSADPHRTWTIGGQPGLTLRADPTLIRAAVDNLLTNVSTHTPPGTTATINGYRCDRQVIIEVADDGPGVPEPALPRLFDRFYRVPNPASGTGSGLGLAIVAEAVSSHGGHISATPNTPTGLRVRITLPAGL